MAISMTPPEGAHDFLARAGWAGADIAPLAGDASFRRYFRVTRDNERAVLMDAPPPHEDPRPFIEIAEWLCAQGFNGPRIYAQDLVRGLVLIEDFGIARMREAIDADPTREAPLYRSVVALLAGLHRKPAMALPPYDAEVYHREVALFTEWYCPALGIDVDAEGFSQAWENMFAAVLSDTRPAVTVLRDYHAENIMLLVGHDGRSALGLLDFQDALVGHPAYDLVSMLQDARRDVSAQLEKDMISYYNHLALCSLNFIDVYHILGAQRNVKILGIFTRLWKRDNKPHYRAFQSRVWSYLERDLAHPALAPVKEWFDANIPTEKRAAAWAVYAE
jgi:aminoglycoside/choline kinase family phosphotransferase